MHEHKTYNTQSTYASVDSTSASPQINFLVVVHGCMQDLPGGHSLGGGRLGKLHGAKRLSTRGVAKRFIGVFGGTLSRENIFNWCSLVRFGAYCHNFFTIKNLKIFIFYTKIMIYYSNVLARGFNIIFKFCNL